jgi:hypothetical protein
MTNYPLGRAWTVNSNRPEMRGALLPGDNLSILSRESTIPTQIRTPAVSGVQIPGSQDVQSPVEPEQRAAAPRDNDTAGGTSD